MVAVTHNGFSPAIACGCTSSLGSWAGRDLLAVYESFVAVAMGRIRSSHAVDDDIGHALFGFRRA